MRRLARRLFTLCSLGAVALWIVLMALWLRSYWVSDQIVWQRSTGLVNLSSSRGGVWYAGIDGMPGVGPPTGYRSVRPPVADPTTNVWRGAGFHYWHGPFPSGGSVTIFRVPMWALLGSHLTLSVFLFRRFGHGKERNGIHCPSCGYDLRATPGHCPECGTVAAAGVLKVEL